MSLSPSLRKFIAKEIKKAKNFKVIPERLVPAEQDFVKRAHIHNWTVVHRPSWPDFLVRFNGKTIGVEVKGPNDSVSPNQARTFDLLEQNNILEVYIWYSWAPDRLVAWKSVKHKIPLNFAGGKRF